MNEFLRNRVNVAHNMIDEGNYDDAVEILKNLNNRIHDTSIITNIKMTNEEIDKQKKASLASISTKMGDPYENFKSALLLKKNRAENFLRFYDNLLIKHEL